MADLIPTNANSPSPAPRIRGWKWRALIGLLMLVAFFAWWIRRPNGLNATEKQLVGVWESEGAGPRYTLLLLSDGRVYFSEGYGYSYQIGGNTVKWRASASTLSYRWYPDRPRSGSIHAWKRYMTEIAFEYLTKDVDIVRLSADEAVFGGDALPSGTPSVSRLRRSIDPDNIRYFESKNSGEEFE